MNEDYKKGQIDALKELIRETHATRTQGDILHAAYEARGIPKAHVDEARELARELKNLDDTNDHD